MEYMVLAADGKEYGPASVETLKEWIADNRLDGSTSLRDVQTGETVKASDVPGLFSTPPMTASARPAPTPGPPPASIPQPPAGTWSQPPAPSYPRAGYTVPGRVDGGSGDIWRAVIYAVLAFVFVFFLNGIGVIFAIYGIMAAFRAKQKGHKLAPVAIVISIVGLVAVAIGWMIRLRLIGGQ
jgi:hypothetical protein